MSQGSTSTTLIGLLARPDQEGVWIEFLARHQEALHSIARGAGLREPEAQDVVQETILACVQGLRGGQYDRARGSLRAWMRGIARNKIHEARRRLGRGEVQLIDSTDATGLLNRVPDPDAWMDPFDREWERAVFAACMELVRKQFDSRTIRAFELYCLQERPAEQVAEALSMSLNGLYIAKSRVLSRMRQLREEIEGIR